MPRPNILLLFTDQQRHDTLRAGGNPVIKTPSLDRLCSEGVRFSSAFTPSPVCVSARCSLVYGQYPHVTGCANNGDRGPSQGLTMMQALADAGYRTHGIGKMHFSPDRLALLGFGSRERQQEIPAPEPQDDYMRYLAGKGFDHVYDPGGVRGDTYYIPQVSQLPANLHPSQWVGDRSVSFINEADARQPFFLFSSFIHPHPPFSPPTPWNKLYRAASMPLPKRPHRMDALLTYANRHQNRRKGRDEGIDNNLLRAMKAHYYACISFVDYQIGRILGALESTGRLENTLILFTSDHGEFLGDYDCFGKRSMLDPASRVPMIARYPERFPRGQVCETSVSLVDVMPTFISAAGGDASTADLPGGDLADIADAGGDRTVYGQYASAGEGIYMAVNKAYKYFYSAADRREYLVDRVGDPEEMRNCAGDWGQQSALAAMRSELMQTLREDGATACLDGESWREFPQPRLEPESVLRPYMDRGEHFRAIPGYLDA